MASFGWLAAVEADRRQGASEVENYGRGLWQEGLRNSTLYVTLVALQYKCILASIRSVRERHSERATKLWVDLRTLYKTNPLSRLRTKRLQRFTSPLQKIA